MRGEGEEADSKSRDGIRATDRLDEGLQASTGRTTLSSSVRDEMALLAAETLREYAPRCELR
jgi:hypothetical protein